MKVDSPHQIGDIVFLITDTEQLDRMVIGIMIRRNSIQYQLSQGINVTWHFPEEIAVEKDIVKMTSN